MIGKKQGIAAACLTLFGATMLNAQDVSLEQRFNAPPKEVRGRVRWWWAGAAVTDAELVRQIAALDKAGFGGAEVQAMTTSPDQLTPEEQRALDDYAEPPFFEHVRAAAAAAHARGMSLDYTLGSAWPSGGGFAITPEKALLELTMARTEVKGGTKGPIKVAIPNRTTRLGMLLDMDPRMKDPAVADWPARTAAQARVEAVIAIAGSAPVLKGDSKSNALSIPLELSAWKDVTTPGTLDMRTAKILTDKLRPDGTLDWTPPPGNWQVFVFKRYQVAGGVSGGAGHGPQLVLDHMNPDAFAAHVARVGDPLGNKPVGIRSTFIDSLELMQDLPWTRGFLDAFKKRRGYDLTPYLPFLVQPGWIQAWTSHYSPPYFDGGDLGERVRTDYRRTVSDLMLENFVEPFAAWNRAHGLQSKFQAHGGAYDLVKAYGLSDIPETEDGDPYASRFARSAADLYGHPIVSTETGTFAGRPYDVTLDDLRRRIDQNYASGVNSVIIHGFAYNRPSRPWPGPHGFEPGPMTPGYGTMFKETNPQWVAAPTLGNYIARTQAVLQAGRPIVPVAYFYNRVGYYEGIEDQGARKQAEEKQFLAGGYDYDRINPDALSSAHMEGKTLVARGGGRYSTLVLPPIDGIDVASAEQLQKFAEAGLPIFFIGHAPSRYEGLLDAKVRDAQVRRAIDGALAAGAKVVAEDAVVTALKGAAVRPNLSFTGADRSDLPFVQRQVGSRTVTFIHNTAPTARDASFDLPSAGAVTRWNAMEGTIQPADARSADGNTRVALQLAPGESALLVQDPAGRQQQPIAHTLVRSLTLPSDKWVLTAEGHLGRQPFAKKVGSAALGDWRTLPDLAKFAGTGTYSRKVTLDRSLLSVGKRVTLDLGEVHDVASVTVNGRSFPPLIGAPFRFDISGAVRKGANDISIAVSNTPQNALVGEAAPGFDKLKPTAAGLVGPIVINIEK